MSKLDLNHHKTPIYPASDQVSHSQLKPVLALSLAIFALGLLLSLAVYLFRYNWALIDLHQSNSNRLLNTVTSLRNEIAQYQDLPYFLAQNREIKNFLVDLADGSQNSKAQVNRYLEQTNLIAGTSALMILNEQGHAVAYSNWRQFPKATTDHVILGQSTTYHQHDFFLQAWSGDLGRQFWTDGQGNSAYYLAAPIHIKEAFVGSAVVRIDVVKLKRQLAFAYDYYVSDDNNNLLFANLTQAYNFDKNLVALKVKTQQLTDGRTIELENTFAQPQLHQWVQLQDLHWRVGLLTPTRQVQQQALIAGAIAAGGYLAFVLFALYLRESYQKRQSREKVIQTQIESEKRQRQIINNAQVGLLTVDKRGTIIFANALFIEQFSAQSETLVNKKLINLLTGASANQLIKECLVKLGQGVFSPLQGQEASFRRFDGTVVPVLFSIQSMLAESNTFYLVTIMDITRRKALEQQLLQVNQSLEQQVEQRTAALKSAQAELVQAEKLAALGRMSTGVVHELNQPLTAMRNYLAIIKQVSHSPEFLSENLSQLNVLVDRMAAITGQLKTFAYKNSQPLEQINLVAVVNKVVSLFQPKFEQETIALSMSFEQEQVHVTADWVRLEQVLTNLIENACQAMIGAENDTATHQLSIAVLIEHQNAMVTVADNGPGIGEEQQQHLFEPFYTTKPMGQGLGLGLAIVHNIVNDLEGKMVVSDHQPGLKIGFVLPIAQEK